MLLPIDINKAFAVHVVNVENAIQVVHLVLEDPS